MARTAVVIISSLRTSKSFSTQNPNDPHLTPNDPWMICYTGGTTGFPKGVAGNHATEVGYIRDVMDEVLAGRVEEAGAVVSIAAPSRAEHVVHNFSSSLEEIRARVDAMDAAL